MTQTKLAILTSQLENLVRGYHPVSNSRFPETSELNDPDIVKLHVQLLSELHTLPSKWRSDDYKTMMQRKKNERLGKPINNYVKWKNSEIDELGRLFLAGKVVLELSGIFERTYGSIIAKLKTLHLLSEIEAHQMYTKHLNNLHR